MMAHRHFNQNNKRPLYTSFGDGQQGPNSFKKMRKQLSEKDVYIMEYVNKDNKGFSGIIKQRYTDFIVNEINLEGNIVRLTNSDPPIYPSMLDKPDIDETIIHTLITEDELAKIKALVELPPDKKDSIKIEVTSFTKEQRTYLHKYVQWVSNQALNTNTLDESGVKWIEVNNKKKGRQEMRRSNASRIKYLHFTVCKTNTDTSEMLFLLGKQLSRKVNKFTIAGSKDKRAVTSQQVSCRYLNHADIIHVKLQRVKLGNYVYKDHPLNLGDLKGNHFRLAIRGVTETDENINETLRLFKENGFVNYFGLQRFGNNPLAATHDVGRLLIQDNWRAAVQLILKPGPVLGAAAAIPKIQKVEYIKHKYYETGSAEFTLRGIDDPSFLKSSIEARILSCLARRGENAYLNALETLNRNTVTLYMHAYQSLVWNRVVSARLAKFGLQVLAGDLVLEPCVEQEKQEKTVVPPKVEDGKEEPTDEDEEDHDPEEEEVLYDIPSCKANVHIVTEEELAAGKYSVADVVYPCPGFDVKLPENEVGTWYYEYLKEDGLTLESFQKKVKLFSLGGSYRRMILKSGDVSWSIVRYEKPDAELQLSDADILAGKTLPPVANPETASLKAVLVELSLPPSVYATMALREVLKMSTSPQYQAAERSPHGGRPPHGPPPRIVRTADGDIDY